MDMRISKKSIRMNARDLMRRCGYGELPRNKEGLVSYVKRLGGRVLFPRFHAYVRETEVSFIVSLHLDQKEHTYSGVSAHSGEYDGLRVQSEMKRIHSIIMETL